MQQPVQRLSLLEQLQIKIRKRKKNLIDNQGISNTCGGTIQTKKIRVDEGESNGNNNNGKEDKQSKSKLDAESQHKTTIENQVLSISYKLGKTLTYRKFSRFRGMYYLPRFLDVSTQQKLANMLMRLGQNEESGFYWCNNEKTKQMKMMNLGRKMNGGHHPIPIPDILCRICRWTVDQLSDDYPLYAGFTPDVAVVNVYVPTSKLRKHCDVSCRSNPGSPVISISLGLTALFAFKASWSRKRSMEQLYLQSGDVLVFGGPSRRIVHEVPQIFLQKSKSSADTTNDSTLLMPPFLMDLDERDKTVKASSYRLNISLRQY